MSVEFTMSVIDKIGLLQNHVPLLAAKIMSRIPVNIVDRFIVVFGGFLVSILIRGQILKSPSGKA